MNFVEYLFEGKTNSNDLLLAGTAENQSYFQIYQKTIAVSDWLTEKVGSNNNIILISDNSLFFMVSYLGIMRSGNTAVVLDTRTSTREVENIISLCHPVMAFIQARYSHIFPDSIRIIDENGIERMQNTGETKVVDTTPDQCAVIIFTSGSTGAKKGVMLSHRNLIANTTSIIQYLHLHSDDRICVVLPFFYCYGASLLHTHIKAGGSLVLDQSIFLGSVIKTIQEYQCTGFAGVPSTYQILITKTPFLQSDLPSLRYLTQAGGHLNDQAIRQIRESFPDKKLYVMYGATEATARLSYLPPEELHQKIGSIGRGIPGVVLEVHGKKGRPVTSGETGEIVARGENIMLGYYQDPKGTRMILRDGWYHTGDLGTIDEEGFIYVTGRIGSFIKSAGFRVSPIEIEDTIMGASDVIGCVVIGIPHHLMGEAIIACVQSQNPTEVHKKFILDHCRRELPTHKIPVDLIFFEKIPLNSSGKPDRQVLTAIVKEKILLSGSQSKDNGAFL